MVTMLTEILLAGVVIVSLPGRLADGGQPIGWIMLILLLSIMAGMLWICRQRLQCWALRSRQPDRIGPYVLKERLGAGGMGDVYLAEHQLMKRHCAVKLIHPEHAEDREMRQNFEREAKATAQLTHWNTIEIYDYGTSEDGRFYYVMEYLKGVNLWHYVETYGPMPPGRVVYILRQLCDALYEADCAGLVHRDVKPSNVFLTERGKSFDVVKLLDFGLVQTITRNPIRLKNVSTKLHGSPSFMCPEQAVGLTPDSRGDLYSLGAVAYFLLTGRPPFVDDNPIMLVVAHATTKVPTFEEIRADVPDDLGSIILKCLSRDPMERYSSARELREVLETCGCCGEWTWKTAEAWWTENAPTAPPRSASSLDKTQLFDRDTACESQEIDFEEPTVTLEQPLPVASC
ncbi:MAG: serine/threonine-protein kinase [Fuerstiella sp.]